MYYLYFLLPIKAFIISKFAVVLYAEKCMTLKDTADVECVPYRKKYERIRKKKSVTLFWMQVLLRNRPNNLHQKLFYFIYLLWTSIDHNTIQLTRVHQGGMNSYHFHIHSTTRLCLWCPLALKSNLRCSEENVTVMQAIWFSFEMVNIYGSITRILSIPKNITG